MNEKISQVIDKYPILVGYEDLVQSVLMTRKAFGLEGVPFEIEVEGTKLGGLNGYFLELDARECSCENCKLNREKPNKPRKHFKPRFRR